MGTEGGGAGVAHRTARNPLAALGGEAAQGFVIRSPRSVLEKHGIGRPKKIGLGFSGHRERVAEVRIDPSHAGPAEVDHDLIGQLRQERLKVVGFEVLHPAHASTFPPRHPRSVRVGGMAGIEHVPLGAHGFIGAHKDHTHGILVSLGFRDQDFWWRGKGRSRRPQREASG